MSMISVDYGVLNQKGSPSWFSDIYANIPTAGYKGRMFISIDTYAFYRDTGTGWDLIGGPGTGTLTGSGVSGQVSFFNGTQTITGNNNLFWDNVNSRLGINTATPGSPLDIHATGTNAQFNGTGTNNASLVFQNAGASKWTIGNSYSAGSNLFIIYNNTTSASALSIDITTNAISSNGTGSYGGVISLKQGALTSAGTGYTTLASKGVGQFIIYFGDANLYAATILNTSLTASRSYVLPNATGVIALTSDLSSYVPYTGATTNVDLGVNNYLGGNYLLKQGVGSVTTTGYISLSASSGTGIKTIVLGLDGSTSSMSYPTSSNYSYTFPASSGTIALTSDLSSYLPLAGGTLTGGLIGTSATFSGNLTIDTNTLFVDSTNNNVGIGTNTYNSNYTLMIANTTASGAYIGATNLAGGNGDRVLRMGFASAATIATIQGTRIATADDVTIAMQAGGGNVLIGTTTDSGQKFQVNGTSKFINNVIFDTYGNLQSKVDSVGASTTKTVTISGTLNGTIQIMVSMFGNGTGSQSRAMWIGGGYLGGGTLPYTEITRVNGGTTIISAITSNVNNSVFTIQNAFAFNSADAVITIISSSANQTPITITIT